MNYLALGKAPLLRGDPHISNMPTILAGRWRGAKGFVLG